MENQEIAVVEQNLDKIRLLEYEELPEEERSKVEKYMKLLDVNNVRSINKYGSDILEKFNKESEATKQILNNGKVLIDNAQAELLMSIDDYEKPSGGLISRAKYYIGKGRKKLKYEIETTADEVPEIVSEKQERLRNELEQQYHRLLQVAEDSSNEHHELELLLIAAKRKYEELRQNIEERESKEIVTYNETEQLMKEKYFLSLLARKIEGDNDRLLKIETISINARNYAYGVYTVAFSFEQDLELLKQDLKSAAIFTNSRQMVTSIVVTYDRTRKTYNKMVRQDSKEMVETLGKIKEMQKNPLLEKETIKQICRDTIEGTQTIIDMYNSQMQVTKLNSETEQIYQDFTNKMQKVMLPLQNQTAGMLPDYEEER